MSELVGTVYMLRTCGPGGESRGGFIYPLTVGATVECPDWDSNPNRDCGGGLHGLPNGIGDPDLIPQGKGFWWQVWRTYDSLPAIEGKARWRSGVLVFSQQQQGDSTEARDSAIAFLAARCPRIGIVWDRVTSGDSGQSTSGDCGQSTSGYSGQSTSGDRGQSTSGDRGQSTSGYSGQSTSGDRGQSTSGYSGQSTSGDDGQSTSGNDGQSTSGDDGQSTSGNDGQSTSGDSGQSTSGDWGQSTSGNGGQSTSGNSGQSTSGNRGQCRAGIYGGILIRYWDRELSTYRVKAGEVGCGDGSDGKLKANTWYRVNEKGDFEEVQS